MKLMAVSVDMKGMSEHDRKMLPVRIDAIVESCCMKNFFRNVYFVEEGCDEEMAIFTAKEALTETDWLRDRVFFDICEIVKRVRLEDIDVGDMSQPRPEKMDYYRSCFDKNGISDREPAYPNPIVIDEDDCLLDGYVTYLIMKERGFTHAECVLADRKRNLEKYICGVHSPGKNKKMDRWAYFLREEEELEGRLPKNVRKEKAGVRAIDVGMSASLFLNGIKKARKKKDGNRPE